MSNPVTPDAGSYALSFQELRQSLATVTTQLQTVTDQLQKNYVRTDLYEKDQKLVAQEFTHLVPTLALVPILQTTQNENVQKVITSDGRITALEKQLAELQETKKWLIRAMVGVVLSSVGGILVAITKSAGP